MDKVVIKAKAKVNLSLDVTGIREDGYHEMRMINHSIELEDTLTFENSQEGITLTSNNNLIPLDEKNLVIIALRKLQKRFNKTQGVKIHIDKQIPAQAGLAGGSSDAAATLKGLNILWKLNLTTPELLEIGVTIGADVPYCLIGGTALVEGIGEKITSLPGMKKWHVVVVKPKVDIPTPWAFKKLDQKEIKNHPDITGIIQLLKDENYAKLNAAMGNVFEEVAFEAYPEIRGIKNDLLANGAIAAIMTGSGSTLVGYYREQERAEMAWQVLKQKYKMSFLSQVSEN